MKKIFALAVSIILMISILIPLASSRIILSDYPSTDLVLNGSSSSPVLKSTAEDAIILEKTIKDGENWVNTYHADPGEIIRFRIKATYHDADGDPDTGGYMLNNITIIDRLPSKLIYLGNSNYDEKSISPDEKYILWEFKDIVLYDTESVIVEFDSVGYNQGTFVNNVDVTAFEHCDGVYRCNTTHATVFISNSSNSSTNITKNIDVDDDNNNETAIDENDDLSDGYEVYEDPDNSSYSIKSIDGDYDGKIDHFIDINIGGIPDKYWDPDDDILTDIQIIDVDYDGTNEWVYDSDNDSNMTLDKYYDPNDNQIHEYVVYELIVNKIGNGNVQINPSGIQFLEGINVTLTAVAFTGENFINYSGDETSNNTIITLTMDANKNITATFTEINIYYTLAINIIGNGTVNPPTGNNYLAGTIVNISATPDLGWQFDSWSGDLSGTDNTTNITMNSNKTITATFTQNTTYYTLTIIKIGSGTVTPPSGSSYVVGTVVDVEAIPDLGWEFASWSGDLSGTDNTTNITMNSNKTITATFTDIRIYYTLTINKIGIGTISPLTGNKYLEGTIVDIRATPNAGWRFTKWTGDLTGSTNPTTITMNSNKEITAHFTIIVTVNITKPENNHLYLFDIGFNSTEYKPNIIGPINIKVQAESDNGIAKVEFYINNELKKTDDTKPYSWIWLLKPKGNEESYTITVKAYDIDSNINTNSINVTRSKFNPILNHKKLILILGVAGLAGLILLRNQGTEQNGVIPNEPDNDSYNFNQAPIIDAGGPYNSRVGEPVDFDASGSYDPDGDLLTYEWNFGDGSIGVGVKQSHTYAKADKYDVKLTVTDSEGNSDTQTIEVEITDGSKTIGISEDDWFWYIVSGLALAITIAVGLLYIGGKLYV